MRTALLLAAAACASAPRPRPERSRLEPLLLEALLAMPAIRDLPRTHTVRLLVGSDEESGSTDMGIYLRSHAPPTYSLVLDSEFPVVVGEKAWDGLAVLPANLDPGSDKPWRIEEIDAGLAPSIVPDRARLTLRWRDGTPAWETLEQRLRARPPDPGTMLKLAGREGLLDGVVQGLSAHAGVNVEGGRNALVSLARI